MKDLIVAALNRFLDCDPERAQQLKQIDGKLIALRISEIDTTILMLVNNLRLQELGETDVEPDVEIGVSLSMLSDYFLGVDRNQLIKNGAIEINGDSHIASVFHNTLREVEIDWEEIAAARVGDNVAHQFGSGARMVKNLLNNIRENARLDTRDYLQDNLQVAVTQEEVNEFMHDVDSLRAQTDRLEARLNRLEAGS